MRLRYGDGTEKSLISALGAAVLGAALTLSGGHALAAGSHAGGHGPKDAAKIGKISKPVKGARTIVIDMYDNYFEPEEITVKPGEVVRFQVVNKGEYLHEFSLGTAAMHAAHGKMMQVMMEHGMIDAHKVNPERMNMKHGPDDAHMDHAHGPESGSLLVEPGKSAELWWVFPKSASLEFGCNMPGHYEAGMMGPVKIK